MTDTSRATGSVSDGPSEALSAFLQTAAGGVEHPPGEPVPDPHVAAAFALGWQMAELYRPDTRTRVTPAAREDLPGLSRLTDTERVEISLMQIDAALAKLAPVLEKAKVPVDTRPLHERLEGASADSAAHANAVRELHVKLLGAFTAADFRLGKAYGLGRALADTCRTPVSAPTLLAEFRPHRIAKLRGWLDDLASALPAHAGHSVSASLERWVEYLHPVPGEAGQQIPERALPGLRRQGQLWRALLSGEKAGQDMLVMNDYLKAADGLFATIKKIVQQFVKRFPLVVALAVLLLLGGVALLALGTSGSIVAGATSILAGLGISWKSLGSALGDLGAKAEQHLWGAELDGAIADAITLLPGTTDHAGRLALATQTHPSKPPEPARPQLLDSVLDPEQLLKKLDRIKTERRSKKYTQLPAECRLPQDHFDDLKSDIEEERAAKGRESRVIEAHGKPAKGVPAPPPVIYMSRKPKVSQFMSVVTHCFEEDLDTALKRLARVRSPGDLWRWIGHLIEDLRSRFREFGPCDIGYIEPKLLQALTGLLGPHAFCTHPPQVRLAENAKVFILGDWATGLPQARSVAARIREQLLLTPANVECHVIHLGDTYYSGLEDECRRRFLDQWPVPAGSLARSWTLAGNHDMYSGGHGYFDVLLADPRFAAQGGCSYFALLNDHWQILGLDSSYKNPDEPDLQDPQTQWLSEHVRDAGGRRTILLTHHQLFSAYEDVATPLAGTVRGALAGGPVEAWLWGHEHRCAIYKRDLTTERVDAPVAHYTALVGHGGVPSLLSEKSGPEGESEVDRSMLDWEFLESYSVGGDRWGARRICGPHIHGPEAGHRVLRRERQGLPNGRFTRRALIIQPRYRIAGSCSDGFAVT